ncbi:MULTISPECIES: helix-turn-helix domain-containing protein [unclassified Haladaptatus]|uniref:TrmB family transcriptional regulator n=1 Tax=unclassified Haladaptatus TaxID=2622732 RepID=UPI00209BFC92|nr:MULTISPECIES: helix-turn-helix domain-containing protein [unclassified Haladaptatus]MCO8245587.1 TrmB family transcriptional regulator [Haladaptatus sp. AB643]MCO8255415.1 TrmB family transcriptional regulator [Haladaptatus sp. AB618]
MNERSNQQHAVELLQQLGLKEYEARCLVALSRVSKATAKELSDISDVPRTRVYDAIKVLEAKGLVEIQNSNPRQYRAVPVEEATETLRQEYESRTTTLAETLTAIEPVEPNGDEEVTHDVWALSGTTPIANRTGQLIDEATEEIVLIIGRDEILTHHLGEQLQAAQARGVDVVVGTLTDTLRDRVTTAVPGATVFHSGLEWLDSSSLDIEDETTITRLVLIDRATILVSTAHERPTDGIESEQAVFGRGFDNGLVVIARRLMATGLRPIEDPGVDGE